MTDPGTVILTSPRPDLLSVLGVKLPGLRVIDSHPIPPCEPIGGTIWCFVDWLLADTSGLEMCRRLRSVPATAHSHITMVLDDDDSDARRRALRAGADDYVLGPLTSDLLLERIQQFQPRAVSSKPQAKLSHGELTLDLTAHVVRWRGAPVPLRPNEFKLLTHFVENPDQVFSRASLIAILGKEGEVIDERTVDVWVGRLRRALMAHGVADPLRTVRSMGYVLDSV
jgi:two-component system, OmpR family, phosphate regulon response regulator PhoB